jgi:hypothetical protein
MAFLRNEKQTKERYTWAWGVIRQYFGWAVVAAGMVGSGLYWLAKAIIWLAENFQWKPH